MLLLDYWPLKRFNPPDAVAGQSQTRRPFSMFVRLFVEKLPFMALSAASCVITYLAQSSSEAVATNAALPFDVRIENALISYALYLKKMLWPDALTGFYPLFDPIEMDKVLASVFVLLLISTGVFVFRRQRPYLVTGWLWYLGTLVPVIGLVQVGAASMADRYSYVPLIGVFIAIAWLMAEFSTKWRYGRVCLAAVSISVLAACWQLTAGQIRYWQNDETLARHALAVTTDNVPMQVLMGNVLFKQGRLEEGTRHFAEALRIWPGNVTATYNLTMALAVQGRFDEAVDACQSTLKLQPRATKIRYLLGNILSKQGKWAEAIGQYQAVLQIDPDYLFALNDLAWLLATATDASLRNGPEAVQLAERACRLSNDQVTMYVGTLAAAYAEAGRFDDAVATAQKAETMAVASKNERLAQKNLDLLELYQQKIAYHVPPFIDEKTPSSQ